jgi:hypothetical protein
MSSSSLFDTFAFTDSALGFIVGFLAFGFSPLLLLEVAGCHQEVEG